MRHCDGFIAVSIIVKTQSNTDPFDPTQVKDKINIVINNFIFTNSFIPFSVYIWWQVSVFPEFVALLVPNSLYPKGCSLTLSPIPLTFLYDLTVR